MANEITVTASLQFAKSGMSTPSMALTAAKFSLVGSPKYVQGAPVVAFAAPAAIPLGSLTTPGWFYIKNLDSTNYLKILTAAAGSIFGKLKAGEVMVGRFGVAAPAWQADTADISVEYLIVED